ncbi:MAG TPA: hypothetical protein VKR55_05680 [Bradyrhizobium sp.]|uniref:hypothetical protein n=1 Tax=Bradyrhizobium sp. TaxID=376 RepID=UPI002C9443B9|nr:hypothetical protein [Bradyrhizobium sp.]HLZ01630.1 hypothetical protein [Bradyrhizobium sp.]
MKQLTLIAFCLALAATGAHAESCEQSREYVLGGLAGDLALPPHAYNDLFKTCLATAAMSNIKAAYILRDGGIAVIPKQNDVAATAATLSQFCDTYPHATLHFFTQKELHETGSIAEIVRIRSTASTPCQKIKGLE